MKRNVRASCMGSRVNSSRCLCFFIDQSESSERSNELVFCVFVFTCVHCLVTIHLLTTIVDNSIRLNLDTYEIYIFELHYYYMQKIYTHKIEQQ